MSKIDNSTFKAIKKDKKQKKRSRKYDSYYKGKYGHAKKYKNARLIFTLLLFLVILTDVVFSLIMFQTRKTWFIIIGCVMSIPFARNLIDFYMALQAKPLDKETYQKTDALAKKEDKEFIYDVTITDTDGVIFIPCASVYNNNIIAFTPHITETKEREKAKKYISGANEIAEMNYRIVVTDNLSTFEKEVKKLRPVNDDTKKNDQEMIDTILSMGY